MSAARPGASRCSSARAPRPQLGVLTQPATGFAIAREAARFAAVALTLSPAQIAADRGLVQRVFALQRGIGKQLLNQRILRIPELQQKLNLQKPQRTPLLEKIKPKRLLQRKTDQNDQTTSQPIERQIDGAPRFRPQIPSGPGGGRVAAHAEHSEYRAVIVTADSLFGLTLRSIAKQCVSKGEADPSFETRSFAALLRMRSEEDGGRSHKSRDRPDLLGGVGRRGR